jgi:peptide/nickel transport system permease protein
MTFTTKPVKLGDEQAELQHARTLLGDTWRQFRKHRLAMIAVVVLILIILFVWLGPIIWNIDPEYIDFAFKHSGPTATHPLGADQLGRDTLARVANGGRISLLIGISAMSVAIMIGTIIGLLSGYFRSLDNILMRITDIFIALPQLPSCWC